MTEEIVFEVGRLHPLRGPRLMAAEDGWGPRNVVLADEREEARSEAARDPDEGERCPNWRNHGAGWCPECLLGSYG